MRYDTPIFFQKKAEPYYNPDTGDYEDGSVEETAVLVSVVGTKEETMKIVYGGIKEDSLTVHLQNAYPDVFDTIRIGNKIYKVDYKRTLRVKQAFVISEVVGQCT